MAELLVTLEDLVVRPCVCGAAEGCACEEWTDAEALAHWDRVVRREVAEALLNLPLTLESAVRNSGKPGVQIAARAGITPKHLSQMLAGKACRVDTWTKVLHAALADAVESGAGS